MHTKLCLSAFVAAALLPAATVAQTSTRSTGTESIRSSWLPYTSQGYVGANVGGTRYDVDCVGGFSCDRSDLGFKLYTGGLLWRAIGLEVGYVHFGTGERAGGIARAQGVNASLVANAPIGPVNLFGKLGGTYGWTKQTAGIGVALDSGRDHGFGVSYGAGVGYDITRNWQVLAEFDRHRLKFASGRDDVDLWSLGVKYRF